MALDPEGLENKTYLGDGLYAGTDGFHVVLYASDGIEVLNEVYLDESTLSSFERWILRLREGEK